MFKFLLACFLSVSAMNAATLVFADGNFASGWSDTLVIQQNSSSITYSALTAPSGGNPTAFRRETDTAVQTPGAPAASVVGWLALNGAASYNPSLQGAISALDFSYSLISIPNPVPGFTQMLVAYGLGLTQNGKTYGAYFEDIGGALSWTNFSHTALTTIDFVQAISNGALPLDTASHPDFSSTGGNIQFGYLVLESVTGSVSGTSGIDNWRVSLTTTPTPEPGTWVGVGIGLLALGFKSMRARLL